MLAISQDGLDDLKLGDFCLFKVKESALVGQWYVVGISLDHSNSVMYVCDSKEEASDKIKEAYSFYRFSGTDKIFRF